MLLQIVFINFSILTLKDNSHSIGTSMEQLFYTAYVMLTDKLPWTHPDLTLEAQAKMKLGHFLLSDWLPKDEDITPAERIFLEEFHKLIFLPEYQCPKLDSVKAFLRGFTYGWLDDEMYFCNGAMRFFEMGKISCKHLCPGNLFISTALQNLTL